VLRQIVLAEQKCRPGSEPLSTEPPRQPRGPL
jgi:hypothetical protein